ncbi:glycosyltransferase [Idiomarina piscisalsi]|uniref:glycosyltransferase n=1 Tax=Idiomarina piscisalsi TaxID=1096243 RepID=UPI0013842144|nr:glycosyltransferase [Idiomarina piscisalsi]MTJ02269.1 glycosyltransferase family 4 protein [Idiomarina piscisalsi]
MKEKNNWSLIIAPAIEPSGRKAVGNYYLEHSEALNFVGERHCLLTVEFSKRKIPSLAKINYKSVNYYKLTGFRPRVFGYLFWCIYCISAALYLFVKEGKPKVILAQRGLLSGTVAFWINSIFGIPYVIIEHSSEVMEENYGSRDRKRLLRAYKRASKIAAVSGPLALSLVNLVPQGRKVDIIPNVAPVNSFKLDYDHNFDTNRPLKLVTVSNLVPNKRVERLIPVIKGFIDRGFDVRLDIIGDGPEYKNLEKVIYREKLQSKVRLLGKLNHEVIAESLGRYDCFVSKSAYETFGVVYLEALLCGVPVITSAGTGSNDIFDGNDFLGVTDSNLCIEDFIKLVKSYWYNDSEDSRRKRRQYVLSKFGYESVGRTLKDFINI